MLVNVIAVGFVFGTGLSVHIVRGLNVVDLIRALLKCDY